MRPYVGHVDWTGGPDPSSIWIDTTPEDRSEASAGRPAGQSGPGTKPLAAPSVRPPGQSDPGTEPLAAPSVRPPGQSDPGLAAPSVGFVPFLFGNKAVSDGELIIGNGCS